MGAPTSPKKDGLIVDPTCPLTSLDLAGIKSVRARMRNNDFEPLAVHSPWSLACDSESAGKAPMGANWQHGQPDYRLFGNYWNWSHAGANTDLVLGFGSIPIQALDFDINDQIHMLAALNAITKILPKRLLVKFRSNSSRIAILARCDADSINCKLQGENGAVERLALGQQVVVHGVHPSGAHLEWAKQRSPWNTKASDISPLDEAAVEAVFQAIVSSGALGSKLDRTSASKQRSGGADPSGNIASAFSECLKRHGTVVGVVRELLRETGQRGTYRHDTLVSVAGVLVRRGWGTAGATKLLTENADRWFGEDTWLKEVEAALEHAVRRQRSQGL